MIPGSLGSRESGHERPRPWAGSAATLLTGYVLLLTFIPSGLTVSALGSLGRPSVFWGLGLLVWWTLWWLQSRGRDVPPLSQPVRLALSVLVVIALISFAAAMFRGQPSDQVSPAFTALVRLASWSGVVLVASVGVRTHDEARRVLNGLVLAGGALGVLGLAQFATGASFLDWLSQVPGITMEDPVQSRGEFVRTAGTAAHPLEYTAFLAAVLPIALTTAAVESERVPRRRYAWLWWLPVALVGLSAVTTVSRSAIVGLLVALIASFPALPRSYRPRALIGALVLGAGFAAVVPGILSTLLGLFTGLLADPSAQSRTDALQRVGEFMAPSPLVGLGFGTFLPRYYILDNQWALIAIELGALGLLAFTALCGAAIWSAVWASRVSPLAETVLMSRALTASIVTTLVVFLFYDGLSYRISPGALFLIIGMTAAFRTIAAVEATRTPLDQPAHRE